jgi:hypothetical protein
MSIPAGPVNLTGVPLQTGEFEVQLQSCALISTVLVQVFAQPSAVTLTSSLVVPEAPGVKAIDWVLLADVIWPLVIDQAYAAPGVAVDAILPADPAQTEPGAVMLQSGSAATVISLVKLSVQPSLPAVRLTA